MMQDVQPAKQETYMKISNGENSNYFHFPNSKSGAVNKLFKHFNIPDIYKAELVTEGFIEFPEFGKTTRIEFMTKEAVEDWKAKVLAEQKAKEEAKEFTKPKAKYNKETKQWEEG